MLNKKNKGINTKRKIAHEKEYGKTVAVQKKEIRKSKRGKRCASLVVLISVL